SGRASSAASRSGSISGTSVPDMASSEHHRGGHLAIRRPWLSGGRGSIVGRRAADVKHDLDTTDSSVNTTITVRRS
ncbi:hypothetical protein, partial [Micromonospora sp. KC723]|uniref:hypothetical protein n=1 Tax=Micromonospora sp. KC723 TaxID=2530381 RepID=UPI001A9CDD3A